MKKIIAGVFVGGLGLVSIFGIMSASATTVTQWNTTGAYTVAFNYLGSDYSHDMNLVQDSSGNLTGNGGSPVGANVYTWVITSGSVSGSNVNFSANYTATTDAVSPQTVMAVVGTVATDGKMSGTWSDNYQGGSRSGTWSTISGAALALSASLSAEDFGVVNYDSGLGQIKGYTAGFGLTNATFSGVQSVVVELYSGSQLLQTNRSTAKVGVDITGAQISSPFDVSGTFDYATDGYWTNVRETEFGQSLAATRVVATVTLSDGRVVTAENTSLTGDPTTIFPPAPVVTVPTNMNQCKNNGWKTFTDPTYKNQGQCVSFVESKGQSVK